MYKFKKLLINDLRLIDFDYKKHNNTTLWKPLFHGTTLYAITQTHDNICTMFNHCKKVIDIVGGYFYERRNDPVIIDYTNSNQNSCFYLAILSDRLTNYMHEGNIYVTTSIEKAITYSNISEFGEVGRFANSLIQAVIDLKIHFDDDVKKSMRFVRNEINKYKESPKIIITFSNVAFKDLQYESGDNVLCGNEEYDKEEIEMLNEPDSTFQPAFKLNCVDYKYPAKVFKEDLFRMAKIYFNEDNMREQNL